MPTTTWRRRAALYILATPALLAGILTLTRTLLRKRRSASAIHCKLTPLSTAVLKQCPALSEYTPPTWLPGPHLNTIGSSILRRDPRLLYTRTNLHLPDGGTIALDWTPRTQGQPLLFLLHGLTGGSHERYVQWMVAAAAVRSDEFGGFSSCIMNARGCSGSSLTSAQSFSAAGTGDARAALAHIRTVIGPGVPIAMMGFSLGAGIMTKFLAEEGTTADVFAAVSLCASLNQILSTFTLEQPGIRYTYNGMLARSLTRFLRAHESVFSAAVAAGCPSSVDSDSHRSGDSSGSGGRSRGDRAAAGWFVNLPAAGRATTIRQYDEAMIVPQFGYKGVWHRCKQAPANLSDAPPPDTSLAPLDSVDPRPVPTGDGNRDTVCTGWDLAESY